MESKRFQRGVLRPWRQWLVGLLAAGLVACGGGGNSGDGDFEITAQPATTAGALNGSATFSSGVAVVGATYQWQRSVDAGLTWANILEAILANYTLAGVSYVMDGYQYRVVVSVGGVSKTSTPTILRVSAPALQSRLGGAAYYDLGLKVTVLADANLPATLPLGIPGIDADGAMSWDRAKAWVAALNAANHLGYSDWRLPKVGPINGSAFVFSNPSNPNDGFDGRIDLFANISAPGTLYAGSTASELPYLYYNTLRCIGNRSVTGVVIDNSANTYGPLRNLVTDSWYWTAQPYITGAAITFTFGAGSQNAHQSSTPGAPDSGWHFHVLVVRDGDSAG